MKNILPKKFVGLHAHSGFSTFDGMGLPKDHFDFVRSNTKEETDFPALAITDHGHMNSYAHAYTYTKELNKAGNKFKFIPGCELYVHPDLKQWQKFKTEKELSTDVSEDTEHGSTVENEDETKTTKHYDPIKRRHHLVVLPKNGKSLEKLFSIVSRGYLEGFYKFPRVDYNMLREHKGSFIASTACIGGPIAYDIFSAFPTATFDDLKPSIIDNQLVRESVIKKVLNTIDQLVDTFGQENLFLELQFNKLNPQHLVNRVLLEVHKQTGLQLLVTADSHYYKPDIWKEREIYKKLGWMNYTDFDPSLIPKSVEDLKTELYPKNASQIWDSYVKTTEEFDFYDDDLVRDAIERTHDIAFNVIGDVSPDTSVKLPSWCIPEGKTASDALTEVCREALKTLGLDGSMKVWNRTHTPEEYVSRLEYELEVIRDMKFSEYFLTMKAIVDVASEHMLIGCGRGSAAGSLVNYVLGITQVDPLKYDLIFERFINRSRCLEKDVLLKTDKQENVKIIDINVGDKIKARTGFTTVTNKVITKHKNVCRLTINGQKIVCSLEHKWIVVRDNEEVEVLAKNLLKSDRILYDKNFD